MSPPVSRREHLLAQAALAREIWQLRAVAAMLSSSKPDKPRAAQAALDLAVERERQLDGEFLALLAKAAPGDDPGALIEALAV